MTEKVQFIKPDASVLVAVPTHGGVICDKLAGAMLQASMKGNLARLSTTNASVLTRNFNVNLAVALNNRDKLTHLCIVHGDIEILTHFWLDKMLDIMKANEADVLSVVSPLKTMEGFTTTGLEEACHGSEWPEWETRRLTLHEIYNDYPPTFTHPKILLNTGLMLIDLSKPWVEQCYFSFEDRIVKDKNGKFQVLSLSEDWIFSKMAKELGAKLFATREIAINHVGSMRFGNTEPWGSHKTDGVSK